MPRTKQKPAQPVAVDRKPKPLAAHSAAPKPELVQPAQLQKTEREMRLNAYKEEGKQLDRIARLGKLEEGYFDRTCLLALADLFNYDSHTDSSGMTEATNWLGAFFSEVLTEVAAQGPAWANAHPEYVKQEFDKAIENLRDALSFCRKLESKLPPGLFEQIENWPAPAEQ